MRKIHDVAKEREPYRVDLQLNGVQTSMEVDTGAAATIFNEEAYKRIIEGNPERNRPQMETAKVKLRTYTGELVKVMGTVNIVVKYEKHEVELHTLVVEGSSSETQLEGVVQNANASCFHDENNQESSLGRLINQYSEVFQQRLGTFTGPKAKIHVETQAQPKFLKARPVPYSMTGKIEVKSRGYKTREQ